MSRAVHHSSSFDGGAEFAARQDRVHSGSAYGLRSHHIARPRLRVDWGWVAFAAVCAALVLACSGALR
jgi:hypothetical protein